MKKDLFDDEEALKKKKDTKYEKWKKAYARLQEQTKPIWGEYLVVQDDFFRKYRPKDGDFSKQWAIKCLPHFDKCLKEKEKYLFEYWEKCKELGYAERDKKGDIVSPYKY